jgi:hypothetical protein
MDYYARIPNLKPKIPEICGGQVSYTFSLPFGILNLLHHLESDDNPWKNSPSYLVMVSNFDINIFPL